MLDSKRYVLSTTARKSKEPTCYFK